MVRVEAIAPPGANEMLSKFTLTTALVLALLFGLLDILIQTK